jgi:hypothetical protein
MDPHTTMTPLDRLIAEQDIARLITRFGLLNDEADWPGVAAMFTADARFVRPAGGDALVGRDAIRAAFESRPPRKSCHLITNILVDVTSANEATARCTLVLYAAPAGAVRGGVSRPHRRFQRPPRARGGRLEIRRARRLSRSQGEAGMTFIHTTHVGSLPRSADLAAMLIKLDRGDAMDEAAFDALVTSEIEKAVRAQAQAGVTIVSDGELGKVGYSTYINKRLSGFGGHVDRMPSKDLADLPDLRAKLAAIMGSQSFTRAACIGPVRLVDSKPAQDDVRRFTTAMASAGAGVRGFMNAASPGLVTAFQPNQYYPTHEAYLADLVDAMRPEYEAIAAGGFRSAA